MGNANKSAILGMNFSTASSRLKKNILHSILVRIGESNCFKCGTEIATPEELSVEHKVAWRTPEQFWDLENIAFSHLRCNLPDEYVGWNRGKTTCANGHTNEWADRRDGARRCNGCNRERTRSYRLQARTPSFQDGEQGSTSL